MEILKVENLSKVYGKGDSEEGYDNDGHYFKYM